MSEVELACHGSAWPEGDFVRSLADIARSGYRAMEARSTLVPEYEDRVLVFQEMLAQQGITLAAVETDLRPVTLEILEEEVERCANVARFLRANDAEFLVLYPPPLRPEGDDREDLKLAYEAINQVGRRTFDLDVRVCIHPECGTIAEDRKQVDRMMEATDPEFVRLCADTGFLAWAGMSTSSFFKKYDTRVDYIHFRDVRKPRPRKGRPEDIKTAAFGRGIVKFKTVARHIEDSGYSGWITVECPGPNDDPVDAVSSARDVAREALDIA